MTVFLIEVSEYIKVLFKLAQISSTLQSLVETSRTRGTRITEKEKKERIGICRRKKK
jgi:hypothetical protein